MVQAHNIIPRRGVAGGLIIFLLLGIGVMLALYFMPLGGTGSGGGSSGGGGGSYMQQLSTTRDRGFDMHAEQTIRQVVQLAVSFEITNNRYPRSSDELYADIPALNDPWGQPYTVEFIEGANRRDISVRISSPGKDGIPGTEDDLIAEQKLP